MGNKIPIGNIIVDANGNYNQLDCGVHEDRFGKIKEHYVIGDVGESEYLSRTRIRNLALDFLSILNELWGTSESTVFGVIGRKGRKMSAEQVAILLKWLRG